MKEVTINIDDAVSKEYLQKMGMKYGLLYSHLNIQLKKIDSMDIDKDILVEARFFNETSEITVYKYDNKLRAILREEEKEDQFILDKHLLLGHFGKEMFVKNYIKFDEDGQGYISYSRPYSVNL